MKMVKEISETSKVSFHFYMLGIVFMFTLYYALSREIIIVGISTFIFISYYVYVLSSTIKIVNSYENEIVTHQSTKRNTLEIIKEVQQHFNIGDVFVKHIENHLNKGEKVICKFCNKDVDTIYSEENKK